MLSLPQSSPRRGIKLSAEHHWVFPDWVRNLRSNSDMKFPGA